MTDRSETSRRGRGEVARLEPEQLADVGNAVRFEYEDPFGNATEAVAVRLDAGVVAFQNVCPHLGFALDCHSETFTGSEGEFLECDAHGAQFDVETGDCIAGPCEGEKLEVFEVEFDEETGEIVVRSKGRLTTL